VLESAEVTRRSATPRSQPPAPTSMTWGNIALLPLGGFRIVVVWALVLALAC
jgi:hypothetical protein